MNLNKNIFRAYDIRGIAYEELSQEAVTLIGKSLGTKSLESGNDSLVVGRDAETQALIFLNGLLQVSNLRVATLSI